MPFLIRSVAYIAIVSIYGAVGWLNFIQAGKLGFLGTFAILTVSSWTLVGGKEGFTGRVANLITFLLFQGIISFQALPTSTGRSG